MIYCRWFAIFASLLLLVTPIAVAEPTTSTTESTVPQVGPSTLSDASPLAYRSTAILLLSTQDNTTSVAQALDALSSTVSEHRGPYRVNHQVGDDDIVALQKLYHAQGTNSTVRKQVSLLIASAARGTAQKAITDAVYVLNRSNVPDTVRGAVAKDLAAARSALRKGDEYAKTPANQMVNDQLRNRQRALRQYDLAWQYAQSAIDRIDASTTPSIWITTRYDAFYNTSSPPGRTVAGTVNDPQPHELSNVTIATSNGNFSAELESVNQPGRNASFDILLENTTRILEAKAMVTDKESVIRDVSPLTIPEEQGRSVGTSIQRSDETTESSEPIVTDDGTTRGPLERFDIELRHYAAHIALHVRSSVPDSSRSVSLEKFNLTSSGATLAAIHIGTENSTAPFVINISEPRTTTVQIENVTNREGVYLNVTSSSDASRTVGSVTYSFDVSPDRNFTVYQKVNRTWVPASDVSRNRGQLTVKTETVEPIVLVRGSSEVPEDSQAPSQTTTATTAAPSQTTTTATTVATSQTANNPQTETHEGLLSRMVASAADLLENLWEWIRELPLTVGAVSPVGTATASETPLNVAPVNSTGNETAHTATATVRFDGDGVADTYEVEVLGTDPLDWDSRTDGQRNVTDNGVSDGSEDFDDDGATNYVEYLHNGYPFDADTDDDDLGDSIEYSYKQLDPVDSDTDNDGIIDSVEDRDQDSVIAVDEVANGTSPFQVDSDFDGLHDDDEFSNGTDPLRGDPDNDTLVDPIELDLGTNPHDRDTDDDGIIDGREQFTTETAQVIGTINATIQVTGKGPVASSVSIQNVSNKAFTNGLLNGTAASPVLDITTYRNFSTANITLGYDQSKVGNESHLGLYRYNKSLQTFVHVNSTVDVENNTVTGITPHFSKYVVINRSAWGNMFNRTMPHSRDNGVIQSGGGFDVMFVIDNSGSMQTNDPDDTRGAAVQAYVSQLNRSFDRAGVTTFSYNGNLVQPLTHQFAKVNQTVESLPASGGTYIGDGLQVANDHLKQESNSTRHPTILLLSDGETYDEYQTRRQANRAAELNITIHTVGFGHADDQLMRDIANETGGTYHYVQNVSNLPEVFTRVQQYSTTALDSDGDGISNAVEEQGVPTGLNGVIVTDPENSDTDGDGLSDGVEIGRPKSVNRTVWTDGERRTIERQHYKLVSNPTVTDTDGDGIQDGAELQNRTIYLAESRAQTQRVLEIASLNTTQDVFANLVAELTLVTVSSDPYLSDTDSDGLNDSAELRTGTNPGNADTDSDSIADLTEIRSGSDPTLFDITPPQLTITRALWGKERFSARTKYAIYYNVQDLSGVNYVHVTKDGDEKARQYYHNRSKPYEPSFHFSTGFIGTTLDNMDGASVQLHAVDRHQNIHSTRALSRTNMWGSLAKKLGANSVFAPHVAPRLGLVSGFAAGLGQGLGFLKLLTNLEEIADIFTQIITLLGRLGEIWDQLLGMIHQSIVQMMSINNPYDKSVHPNLYESYKWSFYSGYAIFFIASVLIPGSKVASVLKRVKQIRKFVDKFPDHVKEGVTMSAQMLDPLGFAAKYGLPKVKMGMARWITARSGIDSRSSTIFLERTASTSSQVRVLKELRQFDGAAINRLSSDRKYVAAALLQRQGSVAGDLLRELDPESRRLLLSMGRGTTESDTEFASIFVQASRSENIGPSEVERVLSRLDSLPQRDRLLAVQFLRATGKNGVQQLSRLPPTYYDEITEFSSVADGRAYRFVGSIDGHYARGFWSARADGIDDAVWRTKVAQFAERPGDGFTSRDAQRFFGGVAILVDFSRSMAEGQLQSVYQTVLNADGIAAANASVQIAWLAAELRQSESEGKNVTSFEIGQRNHAVTINYSDSPSTHLWTVHASEPLSSQRLVTIANSASRVHRERGHTGNLTLVVNVEQYETTRNRPLSAVATEAVAPVNESNSVNRIVLVNETQSTAVSIG